MLLRTLSLSIFCLFFFSLSAQESWVWNAYYQPSQTNDWLETNNRIYLATDAGIYLVDKTTGDLAGHWSRISANLPSNRVESIAIEPATQNIFIGTYDIGIGFQKPDGTWQKIPYPDEIQNGFNPVLTYCVAFDKAGRLLAGTSSGIGRWQNGTWEWFHSGSISPFFHQAWEMIQQEDGELLIAGNVLLRTAGDGFEIISPLSENGAFPDSLFAYSSAHLYRQSNGDIWFITDVGQVGRYDGEKWEITGGFNSGDIPFSQTQFLTEDQEGRLWAYLGFYGFFTYQDGQWTPENAALPLANPSTLIFGQDFTLGLSNDTLRWAGAQTTKETVLGNHPWENIPYRLKNDPEGRLWTTFDYHTLKTMDGSQTIHFGEHFVYDFAFGPDQTCWAIGGKKVIRNHHGVLTVFEPANSNLPDGYLQELLVDQSGKPWVYVYEKGFYFHNGQKWVLASGVNWLNTSLLDASIAGPDTVYVTLFKNLKATLHRIFPSGPAEGIDWPAGWTANSFTAMHYDPETRKLFIGGAADRLIAWDGQEWSFIQLPEGWPADKLLQQIGMYNGNLWVQANDRIAFLEEAGWRVFTRENAPLDTDPIYVTGIDHDDRMWIVHAQSRAIETLTTDLKTTTHTTEQLPLQLRLYPNPVKDKLFAEGLSGAAFAVILDVSGKVIRVYQQPDLMEGIDVNALPSGCYWIKIGAENKIHIGSFVR